MSKGLKLAVEKQEKYNYPLKDKCKHCKEHKALEIIKEKVLPYVDSLEPIIKMTKEEYLLLKEVCYDNTKND